ncbi:uncharacterized protein C8R40DRAFT_1200788 [Lentinula edodes]|uniref:uncharacterized protein n=1 Tax=Lentinula edodes TaxID=5353 RepID=UPI001E8DF088|nr:uncharacterized protein C8R40DRAFT_1200788 [Lentinula edodes]KAH7879638.1 hypothetical protein C8R40DRAFT_1200788 [Lentinula edodes]
MHLIWENLMKNLILHWTGSFKGLNSGSESYEIPDTVWKAIGEATAKSGSTIPSAYGVHVPNIAADGVYMSAEMYSFWTLYLGPVLLHRRFTSECYYHHFIQLVRLLTICLQFEISSVEVEEVRVGFIKWVKEYERIYYQYSPERLPVCPLTIHALLHIAPSIKATGPVWCYWAFPMERYCGAIQPAIRSRRFPFASLARYVLEDARLTQIKVFYDKIDELSLQSVHKGLVRGAYPSCCLLPPKLPGPPAVSSLTPLIGALSTWFQKRVGVVRKSLEMAHIENWGKIQCIDSEAGDTMRASEARRAGDDHRDASYVRYEMLVDKHAQRRNVRSEFVPQTFFGQLQRIYLIRFDTPCPDLGLQEPTTLIMAQIRECKVGDKNIPGLDFHFYSTNGQIHVTDITSVQCVVGRVPCGKNEWCIIDRSGVLGHAFFLEDED